MSGKRAKKAVLRLDFALARNLHKGYVKNGIILNETKGNNMIVRIGCTYLYDMDFNDYAFEQRLRAMGNCDFLSQRTKGGGCNFCYFLERD